MRWKLVGIKQSSGVCQMLDVLLFLPVWRCEKSTNDLWWWLSLWWLSFYLMQRWFTPLFRLIQLTHLKHSQDKRHKSHVLRKKWTAAEQKSTSWLNAKRAKLNLNAAAAKRLFYYPAFLPDNRQRANLIRHERFYNCVTWIIRVKSSS